MMWLFLAKGLRPKHLIAEDSPFSVLFSCHRE